MGVLSSGCACSLHLLQGCLHGYLRLLQQAPAIFLHGCLGVKRRLLKLPLRVVLLVHKLVASVIAAIHGLALQASSMLLLDHAATDILLLSLPVCLRGHCLLLVLFCAVILDISFPILLALPSPFAFVVTVSFSYFSAQSYSTSASQSFSPFQLSGHSLPVVASKTGHFPSSFLPTQIFSPR